MSWFSDLHVIAEETKKRNVLLAAANAIAEETNVRLESQNLILSMALPEIVTQLTRVADALAPTPEPVVGVQGEFSPPVPRP